MRTNRTRRDFAAELGGGMMAAALGPAIALELGFGAVRADAPAAPRLSFGAHDRLVDLMQSTPGDALLPKLVSAWRAGTTLRELVGAAALANARAFGGEDYIGFHTLMALGPALGMAGEQPTPESPLPVLKVIYRNASNLQKTGACKSHALTPPPAPGDARTLVAAVHAKQRAKAEAALAGATAAAPEAGFNAMLEVVEEAPEIHRVALIHRAWEMLDVVGRDHALTMLRQSLGYCLKNEEHAATRMSAPRVLLPKLIERHRLADLDPGTRDPGAAWIDGFAALLFSATAEQAAEAAALALREGIAPKTIFEAIEQTTCELALRDQGRTVGQTSAGKPLHSTHGDSIGVHASDSASAWRQLAAVADRRNRGAATVMAAYQAAYDRGNRGGDFARWLPHPTAAALAPVKETTLAAALGALDEAVRGQDQARAAAVAVRCGELGDDGAATFARLRQHAIRQDGALHAEKYYRTTQLAFAGARPARRWRHAAALARVLASGAGQPVPGLAQAEALLKTA